MHVFKKISAGSFRTTLAKTEVIMSSDLHTNPGTSLRQGGGSGCHTEKYGDSVEAKAAELYQRGLSVRKVAAELGISKSQAHRLRMKLRNAGAPFGSVPPLERGTTERGTAEGGTAVQPSSTEATSGTRDDPADQEAPPSNQQFRGSAEAASGTATPSPRRFIPWQRDPRTGLRYRLWPEDLD